MARLLRVNSVLPAAMRGVGVGAGVGVGVGANRDTGKAEVAPEDMLEAMMVFQCKNQWLYLRIALTHCPIYIKAFSHTY
jgi:hypothetical protein